MSDRIWPEQAVIERFGRMRNGSGHQEKIHQQGVVVQMETSIVAAQASQQVEAKQSGMGRAIPVSAGDSGVDKALGTTAAGLAHRTIGAADVLPALTHWSRSAIGVFAMEKLRR